MEEDQGRQEQYQKYYDSWHAIQEYVNIYSLDMCHPIDGIHVTKVVFGSCIGLLKDIKNKKKDRFC